MRFKTNIILLLFMVFFVQISLAQKKTVTGKVSDNSGEPLLGVTILIKGTKRGVSTDFDGKYKINVTSEDTLVFSYMGYTTLEKKVGSNLVINIILKESSERLKGVVISTGYENVSKRKFTGASSTIKAKDLKIDGVVDVSRMLEGRTAGVNIQNVSGTFGAASKVTIRGSSSIFGNNSPLYVIDGVVQEDIIDTTGLDALTSGNSSTLLSSSIAGINANDIKDIQILKDAAATSIYGARARNGVIIITTKKGRKSSPIKVSYNLEETLRDIPSYHSYDILNSKESVSIFKELEAKGSLDLSNVAQARYGGIYSILAQKINTIDPHTGNFLVENTPEGRNRFLQQYELANTDWFKVLFRKSLTQTHSLSFTGGGEKNAFYASLSYFTDPGWSIAENVKRLTSNIKNTFYFSDKFNLTLSTVASIRKQRAPGTFDRGVDTFRGAVSRDFDINPFSYALNTSRTLRPRDSKGNLEYSTNNWAPFNILNEIKNNYIDLNLRDIRFQVDAQYKILDGLTYNLNASSRYVNGTTEHQIKKNSNVVGAYNSNGTTIIRDNNIFLYKDPNDPTKVPIPVFPKGGIYIKKDNYLTTYYLRNSLSYSKTFKEKNDLDLFAGQELRYVDRSKTSFTGYGLQYENGYVPFTDPRLIEKIINDGGNYYSIDQTRERSIAFFGKATYTYDSKYILSLTGRYDGSNRQGRSNSSRWLPTGTISARWNVSKENFLENSKTINNLQLRASYGLVATPGSATNSLAIFRSRITNRLLIGDREPYLDISQLQNSDLTWEKQYELNLGFDIQLWNRRVSISSDVYSRNIFDNVDFVRTSGIGGEYIKQGNNAAVKTKGIEFNLTTKNVITDNFRWTTSFNISYYNQKITKLQDTPTVYNLVDATGGNLVGYPINSLFSFKFKGLNNRGYGTYLVADGKVTTAEDIDFQATQDLDKFLVYHGSVDPNISGGFNNSFTYKNWSLDVLITGSGGNKIRLNPSVRGSFNDLSTFTKSEKNRWILPGDEKVTNIPTILDYFPLRTNNPLSTRGYNAYNYSDIRVADGSFVRMKNISLAYNFDKDITDKLGLSYFRVKVQGTNLFLIYSDSKLNGQDPEFYQTGGVALPIRRQFTLSLNLGI